MVRRDWLSLIVVSWSRAQILAHWRIDVIHFLVSNHGGKNLLIASHSLPKLFFHAANWSASKTISENLSTCLAELRTFRTWCGIIIIVMWNIKLLPCLSIQNVKIGISKSVLILTSEHAANTSSFISLLQILSFV